MNSDSRRLNQTIVAFKALLFEDERLRGLKGVWPQNVSFPGRPRFRARATGLEQLRITFMEVYLYKLKQTDRKRMHDVH